MKQDEFLRFYLFLMARCCEIQAQNELLLEHAAGGEKNQKTLLEQRARVAKRRDELLDIWRKEIEESD